MGYRAVIYDIDGTVLNTLNMNMYPLMRIIKEETGEDWTFEQVLRFAAYPGMKVMEELGVADPESTYARWVRYVNMRRTRRSTTGLPKYLSNCASAESFRPWCLRRRGRNTTWTSFRGASTTIWQQRFWPTTPTSTSLIRRRF